MNNERIAWLKARKQGIGGSDCAAVLGMSKWKTPLQIYQDKISNEIIENNSEPVYWGIIHEPQIIKKYSIVTGKKCITDNPMFTSKKYPWLFANIDALIKNEPLILEAKSTRFFNDKWGEAGSDEIPQEYLIQCAHYCLILAEFRETKGVDIAALGSTNDFRVYHYKRNKVLEKYIIDITNDFWHKYVLKKEPPPFSNLDNAKDFYKKVNPNTFIVADAQIQELHEQLKSLKENVKNHEKQIEVLKNELQFFMKDKETLIDVDNNKLITWKQQNRKGYTKVVEPTSFRMFKVL